MSNEDENQYIIGKAGLFKKQALTLSPQYFTSDADTTALERQIDDMIYALYCLTPEENAIVERKK